MSDQKTKIILITGCSSGFGYLTAKYLSERGHIVIPTVRHRSDLKLFPNTEQLDLNWSQIQINSIIEKILKKYNRIDVLINNAGYGHTGLITDLTVDDAKEQFETNFYGPLKVTKAVLPQMQKDHEGLIINVSSLLGLFVIPFLGLYSASKYALEAYSAALRLEQEKNNIKVTIINPGEFATSFQSKSKTKGPHNKRSSGSDPILFARLIEKIIRAANPKDRYLIGKESLPIGILLSLPLSAREVIFKKLFSKL